MTSALPARPDLDHLRRQAKDLPRRSRAAEPETLARLSAHAPGLPPALATTQPVIAREHGFSSWAQLKSLVATMVAGGARYDAIGSGYAVHRRPDPRIATALLDALGNARTVVNVGAGTGSYEPLDRPVIPIEPSTTMARQGPESLTPAVLGVAERLPLADNTVDAAMAVLTVHHWSDVSRGLSEMVRVARRRVVLLTIDPDTEADMWLLRDYIPEVMAQDRLDFPSMADVAATLGQISVVEVPVPHDCTDGFLLSFWSRPETVLDPSARAATSGFARMDDQREATAIARLAHDLDSGAWDATNGHLRTLSALDVGLRLIVHELT